MWSRTQFDDFYELFNVNFNFRNADPGLREKLGRKMPTHVYACFCLTRAKYPYEEYYRAKYESWFIIYEIVNT